MAKKKDLLMLQRRVLDLLGMLQAVESQLCADWLMYDGSGKYLQPLIERVSKTIIDAQGTSLWPNAQQLAAQSPSVPPASGATWTADERTTHPNPADKPPFKDKEKSNDV
jgi:hypothetical protein